MIAHIGDDAALYALGALDEAERDAIDAHVAQCEPCARLLGQAEADVVRAVEREPQYAVPATVGRLRPRRLRPAWSVALAAIAAAIVFGILPSLYFWQQDQATRIAMRAQTAAMHRLASAPFRSVAFRGSARARVMYGPDGSWYVIVVRDASKALQVAWMHDGTRTMLGSVVPHGDVAMLYLPRSHRMRQLALMDGGAVVAEAKLAY